MTKAVPPGFSTITPSLSIKGCKEAIELYKKAFGATEDHIMLCPETGKVMHAQLTVGDSKLMLADYMPESGCGEPSVSSFYLYLEDVDSAFKKARSAGLSEKFPPTDMFWGDRSGTLQDKWGNFWTIATHTRDVSPEEMKKGAEEFTKMMKNKAA
ncbi:MAG: VOC family protein [Alphaproteobacteria bacterium]